LRNVSKVTPILYWLGRGLGNIGGVSVKAWEKF